MSLSRGRGLQRSLSAIAAALASVAAVAALVVVPPGAAGAASGGNAQLTLLSQSQWVTPTQPGGPATFTLELSRAVPTGSKVVVTLYDRLVTRSAFEADLRSVSSQAPTRDSTAAVTLSTLPSGPHGGAELRVTVVPSSSAFGSAPPSPSLDLRCTYADGSCTGVYPAVVTLESASGSTSSRFTTFLTYAVRNTTKLQFAWVVPITGHTSIRSRATDPADALSPLPARTVARLEHLVADLRSSAVPVTLEPSAQTVQALAAPGTRGGTAAVADLAAMAADPAVDQVVTGGYVPIDLSALAAAGEPTEIRAQVTAAREVLSRRLKLGPGGVAPTTWIATGRVGSSLGTGLAQVGATHVVVPDTQLAPATTADTWASTFQLPLAGDQTAAAASDGVLASEFTPHGDPVLAATRLLADLAMVHFEEPSAGQRGLVALPPTGWLPTRTFDRTLLTGLRDDPVVEPVTLSRFFSSVAPSSTEPTRHLAASSGGSTLPRSLAHQISTARLRLTTFDRAVSQLPPPQALTDLSQALLAAEASYRSWKDMSTEVGAFDHLLGSQMSQVKLSSTDSSITLTARTGWIPITVVSNAPYSINGILTLKSSKFKFTDGATRDLLLAHPTNPVRVHVVARTLGDSPVTVTFTAPGGLVFAHDQLTVRSTATSVVGVVLTAAALAILLGWWARTWWTGRRRRAAARAGQGA